MKYLEITLSMLLPVLITTLPITLPFLSLSDVLLSWICVVLLLSVYNAAFVVICTPQITKPITRLDAIKTYFTKEILLIIATNMVFSYFVSGFINIWYQDVLHDNLCVFWSTVTSQYFMFDSLLNYKYKYNTSVVKIRYVITPRFRENFKEVFKIVRYVLPVYIALYKDITALTSVLCGSPTEELTFYFLLRPTTLLNIVITSYVTHTLLSVGYQAVVHVASRSTISKVKGETSIEACASHLKSEDVRTRYDAVTDLLRACRNSYTSRQNVYTLQDGHPVIWHIVYKEWLKTLELFNKSVVEKPAQSQEAAPAATESVKLVGRALKIDKPVQLYSFKDTNVSDVRAEPLVTSRISMILSNIANDAVINFKKSAKEYLMGSRIGKYLLTERSDIVLENKLKDVGFMLHGSALCGLLCCAAHSEDKYGVIQLVLPEILNTVAATLRAIDQVPMIGSTTSHTRLKRSLHLLLHHITNTYQSSIFNLTTLNMETTLLLQQFYV